MVYIIGASSLKKAIGKAPSSLRRSFQGKVFAVSGLGLHPTAKNPLKKLHLLLRTSLKERKNILLWHDLINNSLSAHDSNGNTTSSPETLIRTLESFRNQVCGILYNQRIGTPNIQKDLVCANYLTINAKRHLLSNRKRKNPHINQDLWKIHPSERLELHLLQIILKHEKNLVRLITKNRSKRKKNLSQKRRKRQQKGQ